MAQRIYGLLLLAVILFVLANVGASVAMRKDDGYGLRAEDVYLTDEYRLYRLRPKARAIRHVGEHARKIWANSTLAWRVQIDSMGFRDPDDLRTVEKPDGRLRIVALGDSHTFGLEAPDERTFSVELQSLLNKAANQARFEVINAGVPGYSSRQGLIYLTHDLGRLDPDMLILQFGSNDASRAANFLSKPDRMLPDRTVFPSVDGPIPADIQRRIFWIDRYVYGSPLLRFIRSRSDEPPGEAPEPRATPEEFRANLQAMKAWADEREAKVVLLQIDLEPAYAEVVRRLARDWGAPLVSADGLFESKRDEVLNSKVFEEELRLLDRQLGAFYRRPGSPYLFTVDERHPNAVGHALIAQALYAKIVQVKGFSPR